VHVQAAGDVQGAGCNSVFGPTWRHVGVVSSQYLNKGKLCISDVGSGGGRSPRASARVPAPPPPSRLRGPRDLGACAPCAVLVASVCVSCMWCNCAGSALDVCRPASTPSVMCSMPWEKRHGLPSVNEAKLTIVNTAFAYFRSNDCGLKVRFKGEP
jgi:hypothetical protein